MVKSARGRDAAHTLIVPVLYFMGTFIVNAKS
jgi:hypothetical protein